MKHILVRRFGLALACALFATLLVGTLDVFRMTTQDVDSVGGFAIWMGTTGLWTLPCLLLTLSAVFGGHWLLTGYQNDQTRDADVASDAPRDVAALLVAPSFLGLLCLCIWGACGAGLLSSDVPVVRAGAILGLLVLFTLLPAAWLVRRFGAAVAASLRSVPTLGVVVLASLPWLAFLGLVHFGETSGAGGPFKLWGVLRREELDLSFPGYAALALGFGLVAARSSFGFPRFVPVGLALGLVGLTMASRGMNPSTAFRIEQAGSASARLLRTYQRFADLDGDGFAAHFGGGDCNDSDAAIQPEANDVAGNGIDEDCSGADANPETVAAKASDVSGSHSGVVEAAASAHQPTGTSPGDTAALVNALPKDANLVFITIDTLRYDLGYAGNPRPLSPNLDKLSKKALVYDNAYALASYTSKSLGPLMIGRYGSETNRGWMHFNKYPASDTMVQERLSGAGIFTLSVQGHWYFKADTGLGRGFDVLDLSAAPERPQGEGDKTVNSEQISNAAIALLKQPARSNQRFFMWVHYLDPHAEYVTHADFSFGTNGRAKYDAEIAFTDHHVGRVLDTIESADFAKRTIIVVTSDHGEAFGEHGLIRHGFELWEELIHVPLLVYVPGAESKHIKTRRSAIDLVPTFLDVFGVPLPSGDDFLSGQSLANEWSGGPSPERPIFVDMPAGPYNGDRQAYIDQDLKLVVSNSRPMGLYDLAADPGETQNLSNQTDRVAAQLERFKAFRSKLRVIKVKPQ